VGKVVALVVAGFVVGPVGIEVAAGA
jgi:hypothetical protein